MVRIDVEVIARPARILADKTRSVSLRDRLLQHFARDAAELHVYTSLCSELRGGLDEIEGEFPT